MITQAGIQNFEARVNRRVMTYLQNRCGNELDGKGMKERERALDETAGLGIRERPIRSAKMKVVRC
jgi:hypothetical protein